MENNVIIRKIDDIAIVNIIDILTTSNSEEFKHSIKELVDSHTKNIIIDFELVSYIDSSGLGALLTANELVDEIGGNLRLATLNQTCLTVLDITYLTDKFDIFPDLESALEF